MGVKHVFSISVVTTENQLVKGETKLTVPDSIDDRVNAGARVLKPFNYLNSNIIITCLVATIIGYYVDDEKWPPAENECTNHDRKSSRQFDLDQHGPSPFCTIPNHAVNVSV